MLSILLFLFSLFSAETYPARYVIGRNSATTPTYLVRLDSLSLDADSARVAGLSDSAKALVRYARTTAVHDTADTLRKYARDRIKDSLSANSRGWITAAAATFQSAYNNSTVPQILTDATRGALTIKRGSAADPDAVLAIQDGSGVQTATISGSGTVAANQVSVATATANSLARFDAAKYLVPYSLVAADIPSLDASKITTGTFPDARISSAATWNAKVDGSGTTNTIPKFTGSATLGDSPLSDLYASSAGYAGIANSRASLPTYSLSETSNGTDAKNWVIRSSGSTFALAAFNDAWTSGNNAFSVTRSGTTVAGMQIYPPLELLSLGAGFVRSPASGALTSSALVAADLPNSGVTAGGPTGSSSVVPVITYDAKGRLTTVSTATITPAAIGALPTGNVSGTSGQVAAFTGANTVAGDGGLTRDRISGSTIGLKLGDGTTVSPTYMLIDGPANQAKRLVFLDAGVGRWAIDQIATSAQFRIRAINSSGGDIDNPIAIDNASGGTMALGGAGRPVNLTSGSRLQVNGTDAITSARAGAFTSATVSNGTGSLRIEPYLSQTAGWVGYPGFNLGAATGAGFWAWSDGGIGMDVAPGRSFTGRVSGSTILSYSSSGVNIGSGSTLQHNGTTVLTSGRALQNLTGVSTTNAINTTGSVQISGTDAITSARAGSFTSMASSGQISWNTGTLRQNATYNTQGCLYADGVTPGTSNCVLLWTRDGTAALINGASNSYMYVNGSPAVWAQSSGVTLYGTVTAAGLTGSTTRVATIDASGNIGAGTISNTSPQAITTNTNFNALTSTVFYINAAGVTMTIPSSGITPGSIFHMGTPGNSVTLSFSGVTVWYAGATISSGFSLIYGRMYKVVCLTSTLWMIDAG